MKAEEVQVVRMSPPPLKTSQSLKISSKAPKDCFLVKLSYLSVSPQPKPKANSLKSSPPFQI
ncbi:hypothetical protein HKD37_16G045341 [Glycine soja]